MSTRSAIAKTLLSAALVAGLAQPAAADKQITFGTYSSDKPSSMVKQLLPIINWLSDRASQNLGEKLDIRIQVVRGYEQGLGLIAEGRVDFARLGPASYVKAKEANPGLSILAMESKNGNNFFHGIIAVHKDSPYNTIADLRGVTFGFGNKRSTLGRYFAQLHLTDAGIRADDLKEYKYLGRHDAVGRAVGSRLVDAGALEETTFQKLVRAGTPIRGIAKMKNATRPWVARNGLDKKVFMALQKAMLSLDNPKLSKRFRFQGFLPGTDTEYEPTRRAIRENARFFNTSG